MNASSIVVTGMGVRCSTAGNVAELNLALRSGRSGVQKVTDPNSAGIGALIPESIETGAADGPDDPRARRLLNRSTPAARHSMLAAFEAAAQAGLAEIEDRRRIALVVAGDALSLGSTYAMHERFVDDPVSVRPSHSYQMWNSYLLGCVSEILTIKGEGQVVSGASASGNVGLLSAARLLLSGEADVCLAVAAMHEFSPVEVSAFKGLGALAEIGEGFADEVMRPFDQGHRGFVLGEGAAAMVLERSDHATARKAPALATLRGGATVLDGHHQTQPNLYGEISAMTGALSRTGLTRQDIDLISAHGTSTPLGDDTEAAAIDQVFGADGPTVNATKSMLGHCLGPASGLSAVACVLQLRGAFAHPNLNLVEPVQALSYAPASAIDLQVRNAMNNSFAFGGINTSVIFGQPD